MVTKVVCGWVCKLEEFVEVIGINFMVNFVEYGEFMELSSVRK